MSSVSESNRTVHLSNLPFQGGRADFEKYKQIVADAFKAYDFESAHISDRTREGKTVILAHVTFKTPEGAQKALQNKVVQIQGKQVIIEKYISEKDYQLYIKDVGRLSQKEIENFFGANKKVNHVHMYTKDSMTGTSAIISFVNPADAAEYLAKPQQTIQGVPIKIDKFIVKEDRDREEHKQLYLMYIPIHDKKVPDLEKELTKEFSKFGRLTKDIEIEFKQGSKTGSAFVSYENSNDLEKARQNFNVKLFGGDMKLEYFLTKKEREQRDAASDSTIFINNILGDVDINKFIELFSQFGKITNSGFSKSPSKTEGSIQRGTITFSSHQEMNEALAGWPKIPNIYSYFVLKKPYINIYQDKTERNDYLKTIKPSKPQQNQFNPPPRNPYMMPGMGMPLAPMGMGGMGMPMGMPMPMNMPGGMPGGIPGGLGMQFMNPGMLPSNPLVGGFPPQKATK